MENKSHALIAGLFTVSLGVCLALAAMWFSRDRTERVDYELVTARSVSGLAPEAAVRFRGVEIGKVESIGFDPDHLGQILVRIGVAKGAPITKSTFAQLAYQGVTGLSFVQLDDDGSDPAPLPSSADHVARITIQPSLLDQLSGGSQAIVSGASTTVTRLNMLLAPENQKVLTATLQSLDSAAHSVTVLAASLGPALSRLPPAIEDTRQTMASVKRAADSYDRLAESLQDSHGTLARISESLDQFNAAIDAINVTTLPRLNALSDDASRTARSVTHATDRLDEQPQSLLFGRTQVTPGPGEPGFAVPH